MEAVVKWWLVRSKNRGTTLHLVGTFVLYGVWCVQYSTSLKCGWFYMCTVRRLRAADSSPGPALLYHADHSGNGSYCSIRHDGAAHRAGQTLSLTARLYSLLSTFAHTSDVVLQDRCAVFWPSASSLPAIIPSHSPLASTAPRPFALQHFAPVAAVPAPVPVARRRGVAASR